MSAAGKNISEETREKMRKAKQNMSESTKEKLRIINKGKRLSEDTKIRIRIAVRNMSEEAKRKKSIGMSKLILNTQTGVYYSGSKEAADSCGINVVTLNGRLNGSLKNNTNFIRV